MSDKIEEYRSIIRDACAVASIKGYRTSGIEGDVLRGRGYSPGVLITVAPRPIRSFYVFCNGQLLEVRKEMSDRKAAIINLADPNSLAELGKALEKVSCPPTF